jgi:thioredoxin-related protein
VKTVGFLWMTALGATATAQEPTPAPKAPAGTAATGWNADYDVAAKLAKEQGKDLLVDFTGSGWCGWCTRLHDEVFVHDEFLSAARERYVLVALDFESTGESKEDQPNPKRNNELKQRWRIRGFPSVLLVTADGDVFGRTGYQEGGAAEYVKHLATLHETGKQQLAEIAELGKRLATTTGEEQLKVLDEAIAKLEGLDEDAGTVLAVGALVRKAFTIDPDDAHGRKSKAVLTLFDAGIADQDVLDAATALDPKNEKGILEKAVLARLGTVGGVEDIEPVVKAIDELDALGPIKDQQIAFMLYINAAIWSDRFLQQKEQAKRFATKVKELGVDDPRALAMVEQILQS